MKPDPVFRILVVALLAGCASAPPPEPADASEPYTVEFGPDAVTLAIPNGGAIPLRDFVKIAQRATGRVIVYRADDLAGDDAGVRFVGTLRVANDSFFSFFETMLHVNGFACTTRGAGDTGVIEVHRRAVAPASGRNSG